MQSEWQTDKPNLTMYCIRLQQGRTSPHCLRMCCCPICIHRWGNIHPLQQGLQRLPGSHKGDSQSTSYDRCSNRDCFQYFTKNIIYTLTAQSVALVHTCPQPLEQHSLPGPQSKPTPQLSTYIPNPVGVGHTAA